MTKQIKSPILDCEIYGYITNPTTNKKEVILYGWNFNVVNKECIINKCVMNTDLLNKHYKFINQECLKEISPLPKITLTFQALKLNNSCDSFNNTLLGRYELPNCTIKVKSMGFMPGRRVVACLAAIVIESSKYYEESCEKFIDEILKDNE